MQRRIKEWRAGRAVATTIEITTTIATTIEITTTIATTIEITTLLK